MSVVADESPRTLSSESHARVSGESSNIGIRGSVPSSQGFPSDKPSSASRSKKGRLSLQQDGQLSFKTLGIQGY